nr:hypothetical protein [Tanacetum cinerariifolium]
MKLEIIKLKARVKRLEKPTKVKSSKLRHLRKVEASKRVESSDDMEDVFNQGRMIDDLDKDEGIELAEIYHLDLDHSSKVLNVVTAVASQVSAASVTISAAKPSIPVAAPIVVAAYTRRRKGVIIRDPEEELSSKTPTETPKLKDKGKAWFDENMRFLFKSREEMEEEDQEIIKSINETLAQKAAKRKKLNEQDVVWKSQRSVHGLALLILFVERRYPLSRFTLKQLVNVTRLQVEEESEMSLELLRFTRQQLQEYQQG